MNFTSEILNNTYMYKQLNTDPKRAQNLLTFLRTAQANGYSLNKERRRHNNVEIILQCGRKSMFLILIYCKGYCY